MAPPRRRRAALAEGRHIGRDELDAPPQSRQRAVISLDKTTCVGTVWGTRYMGKALDLPDAELEVLACLQRQNRATAREIRELMQSYRPMGHASVLTLLTRLEGKGLVTREKGPVGKAFVYIPTQRSRRTGGNLLKKIVQRVFHGDGVALVASLFQTKPPSREELARLDELLSQLRAQRSQRKASDDRQS
jgi:BlaI family transcriptional regulator, penicillinase repressor